MIANPDVLLTRKDLTEFVLILKGESLEQLEEESAFLTGLISEELQARSPFQVWSGAGAPQQHLSDLHRSFAGALRNLNGSREETRLTLETLDHAALRRYLEEGRAEQFDAVF